MAHRYDWDNLIRLFRITRRETETIPVTDAWRRETMHRIRSLAREPARQVFATVFEPFVWRLVPVTLAMILILSIALSNFDLVADAEVFGLFSYELEDAYAFLDPE